MNGSTGKWVSVTTISTDERSLFLQRCKFQDVILRVSRVIAYEYNAEQLEAEEKVREQLAVEAGKQDPIAGALMVRGPWDLRHIEVVRNVYTDLEVAPTILIDIPLEDEFWRIGTFSRTAVSDTRVRFQYQDVLFWSVEAENIEHTKSTPRGRPEGTDHYPGDKQLVDEIVATMHETGKKFREIVKSVAPRAERARNNVSDADVTRRLRPKVKRQVERLGRKFE